MSSRRTISSLSSRIQTFTSTSLRPAIRTPRFLAAQPHLRTAWPNRTEPSRASFRQFSISLTRPDASSSSSTAAKSDAPPSKIYNYTEISDLSQHRDPHRILIDVREPSELQATGRIPGAINLPIKSAPDFAFLSPDEFEDRYGVARPGPDDEVIFYCKSGVRSRAAAALARQAAFGGAVAEYPGSWTEWSDKGGESEKV